MHTTPSEPIDDVIGIVRSVSALFADATSKLSVGNFKVFAVTESNGDCISTVCLTQGGAHRYIEDNSLAGAAVVSVKIDAGSDLFEIISAITHIESSVITMIARRLESQSVDGNLDDAALMVRRMGYQREIEVSLKLLHRTSGDCNRIAAFFCDAGIDMGYIGKKSMSGFATEQDMWSISDGGIYSANDLLQILPLKAVMLDGMEQGVSYVG